MNTLIAQSFVVAEGVADDRAAIALDHDDNGRLVFVIVKIMGIAVLVEQHEIVNALGLREGGKQQAGKQRGNSQHHDLRNFKTDLG